MGIMGFPMGEEIAVQRFDSHKLDSLFSLKPLLLLFHTQRKSAEHSVSLFIKATCFNRLYCEVYKMRLFSCFQDGDSIGWQSCFAYGRINEL